MNSKSEQILEAIDVLMDEKVSNLQFDKTIQAIVQSVKDVDTGEYRVEYNAGIISAFATDPKVTYKKGDAVYVTVPEGDFSNKKFISHRITNNSLTTGQYTELASTFFEVSPEFQDLGYIYIDQQDGFGLVAGSNSSLDILNESAATASTRFQAFAERYEYIQISAEFMTEFLEEHSVGDYGIKVIFENQEDKEIPYVLNLNSFNGDPYRLSTWSPQSTIIQIPKGQYKTLKKIVFYEEGFQPEGTNNNIFMQNLSLYFVEKVDLTEIPYYLNILPLDGIAFTTEQSKLRLEGQPYSSGELLPADNCIFQWFERDLSVTPSSAVYDKRAGWGWKGIVKDNLISFYEIKEASEKKVESIRLRRRLKGSKDWENVNTKITSDVYYDTKISSDALVEYEYQYMLNYEDKTKSKQELISYTKEYDDANSLTIKKEQVPWQKSYKLVVVYNSTTLMTKEITLINLTFNGQVEIRQVNNKNSVTLELTNSDYLGDWYYLASNGNQVKINEEKTSSVEVTSYLLYSPITFYCSVYQKQESGGQYLGELSYVMQNVESEDDVSVVFSGESFFSYDANGDINIYDAELERSLQVKITWKEGVISSASTIKCFDFEGNEIDENGIDYQAKDSMLKKVRFDKEENTLYYVVKHKYKLTPARNNTFQIQISTISGQVYNFYKEIVFIKTGDPGTNGTKYQSLITIVQDNLNKNKFVNDNASVKLNCKVYKDDAEFAIDGSKIVWQPYNLKITSPQPDTQGKAKGTDIIVVGDKNSSSKKRYVKVTINIDDEDKSTTLYDFFPIDSCDIQPDIDMSRLPKYVQYNANGRNPQFRNSVSGFDALISSSDTNVITNVQYILLAGSKYCTSAKMTSGTAFIENDTTITNCSFAGGDYPNIIKFKFNTDDSSWHYMSKDSLKQQFKVVDEFNSSKLAELSQIGLLELTVLVTEEQGTIQKIIYHPVPTYINTYGNEAINGWDGTEVFLGDDETHAIFAPQVGAGKKSDDNKFTGVVMGQDSNQKKIGLYGYQAGVNSFGLTEDGIAYFGVVGKNRITIDGTQATIFGGGGGGDPTGMTITLSASNEEGTTEAIKVGNGNFIVTYGGKLTATSAKVAGEITAESGKIGNWTISGNGDGALRSTFIDEDNEIASARIYLNGKPATKDEKVIEIKTSYKKEESTEDEEEDYVAHDYGEFYVTAQGKMVATGAEFHGTLKSSEGQIGGWIITKDKLYSDNLKRGLASIGVMGYEEYNKAELESQHELLVPKYAEWLNITLYQTVYDKKTGAVEDVFEKGGYWLSQKSLDTDTNPKYSAKDYDLPAYAVKFRYSIGNYVIFSFTKESIEYLRYTSHPRWWKNRSESPYGMGHRYFIDETTTFKVQKKYIQRSWATRDPSYKLEFVDNFVIWSGGEYREPLYRKEPKGNEEFQKIYILEYEDGYREKQADTPEDLTEEERAHIQEGIVFSRSDTYFGVTDNGKMYCSNAVVRGTVYAEGGTIGSWQIGTKQDEDGNVYQYLGAGGTELQSTGCIKITNSDEGQLLFFSGNNKSFKVDCEGMYYYGHGTMYINLTSSTAMLKLPPLEQIMIGDKTFAQAVSAVINIPS